MGSQAVKRDTWGFREDLTHQGNNSSRDNVHGQARGPPIRSDHCTALHHVVVLELSIVADTCPLIKTVPPTGGAG